MVPTVEAARELIELDAAGEALLTSLARPIVLAPARVELDGVAPDNLDLGVMLPYDAAAASAVSTPARPTSCS